MKLLRRAFIAFALILCLVPQVFAAVDVTPFDLQNSAKLLKPDGSSLGSLTGFSPFYYRSQSSISGGILTRYQALLLSDPWLSKGLPELQLLAVAYADQDAADLAFDNYRSSGRFSADDLTLISETSHAFFYSEASGGEAMDLFKSVSTSSSSYHWLEKNGNVLIQASLYLGEGPVHQDTLSTFSELSSAALSPLLSSAANAEKISLGLLFPPENPLFSAQTESSSLDLSKSLTLPKNGTLSLDVYVSDPSSAQGTILDSSGLLSASDGDFYLYITKTGKVLAGLYAPYYDADCTQSAGWYSVSSGGTLYPYEWNHIVLNFGVGGFALKLNDEAKSTCSVSQALTSRPLYLGDYPSDSVSEGMLGVVDHVTSSFSTDDLGRTVDTVLQNLGFLDVDTSDADYSIFKALKDKKVFMGSDGLMNAEGTLNRAAMVKIITRAFALGSSTGTVSFWDVPSDAWYRKYLAKAVEVGMVKGRADGSFGGGDLVTRAEFFTMLSRLDESFSAEETPSTYSDVKDSAWYFGGASYAQAKGFVSGTTFDPNVTVTRREAARVLYALMKL